MSEADPQISWRQDLAISGMTCATCVGRIEKALLDLEEVVGADVNLVANRACVTIRGTELSSQDLMRPDLNLVPATIEIARATTKKIRQNLFWAFAYNIIAIPLAILGFLNPVIAGTAMAMSSVSVVTNSLLLAQCYPSTCKTRKSKNPRPG